MKKNYFLLFMAWFTITGCGPGPSINIEGEQYYVSGWALDMERVETYGTYYTDTLQCKNKECGKAIFFHRKKHELTKVYIIDFDNKQYSIESIGEKKINNITYMKPSNENAYRVLYNKNNHNKFNFVEVQNPKNNNIYYYVEPFYEKILLKETVSAFADKFFDGTYISQWTLNTDLLEKKGFTFNPNIGIKSTKNYQKDNNALQHFIDINNLYEIVKTYKSRKWYPVEGNNNTNITGKGAIQFKKRDYQIHITGTFNNGRLISNGKIKISRWFSDGGIHLFSPYTYKDVALTPSSNIKQVILNMYKSLNIEISNIISKKREARVKRQNSNNYVMVTFESVCGLYGCSDKNLHISGGPGRFSPSYDGATSGAINKGYNGGLAGHYNWTAQVNERICSGSFYLKEGTKNISLNTYSDCHDPYDHQY